MTDYTEQSEPVLSKNISSRFVIYERFYAEMSKSNATNGVKATLVYYITFLPAIYRIASMS